jgi:hypothetical protein
MRSGLFALAFSALLAVTACAPSAPPVAPGAPLTPASMQLTQRGHERPVPLVELKPDGSVIGPSGEPLGKIQGNKILDEKGKVALEIGTDGAITGPELTRKLKFNSDGDATDEKGAIRIGSDGVVVTMDPNGELSRTPLKFENYNAADRRTGVVLLLLTAKHLGKVADLGVE